MRRLSKNSAPEWLQLHQEEKTREYLAAPKDHKPRPWSNTEVINALKIEASHKCIYCESIIDDVSYSTVDHIKPKKVFPDMVLDWKNLGIACSRCNTNKSDYWTNDEGLRLLNPFEDDIEEHLQFLGPLTVALLSSSRGKNTLRQLKFVEREDLLISRMRRIEDLDRILRIWADTDNPEYRAVYAEDVRDCIGESREFAGVLRSYAASLGFEV
ncbi:HNH endonuclease [Rathayibacter sp. AY1E2]|uniref:HNH endonuclease n=1 Tax=Rathayibacter sp. AY1E2 TaxID=2080550 RepID=UPI000CE7BDA4|nr:HNH endonuclease [Rathayibacter sp. AY1E2]PPH51929.1 hypothetical protein C5C49_10145 [Rathayibacter sp. AY1E2]